MPTNYVLIDSENVAPTNLQKLNDLDCKVYLFLGEKQTRIPVELARGMQVLGSKAHYIQMSGNGPNALDFHIAFYAGELATADPEGYFHIISRDSGFDPLIAHLRNGRKPRIRISRHNDIGQIPPLQAAAADTTDERVALVLENFQRRSPSLPRKRDTLHSTINSLFGKKLSSNEVDGLIDAMRAANIVNLTGPKAQYNLPVDGTKSQNSNGTS